MGRIEARLAGRGIVLPVAAAPVANYVPWVITGNLLFVSGQLPLYEGKLLYAGKLGQELAIEEGYKAARQCGLNLAAQIKAALHDLDRVRSVAKLTVFVACPPSFTEHPKVANGASDVIFEIFAEAGRHARAAVGCPSLPLDAPVEVDAVVEFA
jgi:enamine deaminase RidA (YjgF/YER057c/UK114 family)